MGGLGCGISVVAALFALLGLFPLLGWLNWFTTLPAALLAVLLGFLGVLRDEQRGISILALVVGVGIFAWAVFRLSIGGGII